MEYRKIIEFGKSSYVVSLPKQWLKDNNLKKGDVLYVDKEDSSLSLHSPEKYSKSKPKKVELDITGLSMAQLKMLIVSKYIGDCDELVIRSKDLAEKAEDVRGVVHDLIALEIMEESSEKILVKDFLNMEDINLQETLEKMDTVTKEMIKESKQAFEEKKYPTLSLRDKDVNRLSYLALRSVRYMQRKPAFAKESGYSQEELTRLWNMAFRIEAIADNAKRIAKMMGRVKISKSDQKEFLKLYSQVEDYYNETVEAYFKRDQSKAIHLRPKANQLIKKCKDFFRSNWNIDWMPSILEKLKAMVADTKSLTQNLCDISCPEQVDD